MREPISLLPLAAAIVAAIALFAATGASTPAPASRPGEVMACNLRLDIVDPDPKGLNVRATPAGQVSARLLSNAEWTEVHVTGQSGDWLRIDRAEAVDDDAPEGMRQVFRGTGWVHVSGLGVSELGTGEGTVLRAAPSDGARKLLQVDASNEPKRVRVLGCRAKWLHVEADGRDAWTRTWCNNQRTTCS